MRKCFPVELVLLSLSVFVVHGAEVSEGGDGARLLSDVRARVSQRRYRTAREIALTALRSARPGLLRAELEFWVGESYRLEGDPEEAVKALYGYLSRGPSDGTGAICQCLCECYLEMGETEELRSLLSRAPCGSNESDWKREALGAAYFTAGRFAEARSSLERVRERGSTTWFTLGRLAFHDGNYAEALRCFEAARTREPESFDYENEIYVSMCLLRLNRLEDARERVGRILAQVESPEPHLLLGRIELRADRMESALRAFQRAHELEPALSEAQFGLATALKRLGRTQESKEAFELFGKLHEKEEQTRREAYSLAQKHLRLKGGEAAQVALDISKRYLSTGDLENATSYAWRAVRHDPKNSRARLSLARSFALSGRYQAASVHYRKVLKNPLADTENRADAERELRELVREHARSESDVREERK